jgi:hypothetical protein
MRPKEMTLETLIGKEAILTLLTVQRWPVVDHLGVDLSWVKEMLVKVMIKS